MRHKRTTELRYPGLSRGCVGAWAPCLGATGTIVRDWSPFRSSGTLASSSVTTALSMQGLVAGKQSITTVSAINQTLDLNTTLPSLAGQPAVTLVSWMRRSASGDQFHAGTGSAGSLFSGMLLNSDNNVYFMVQPNFPSFPNSSVDWQCVALTLASSTIDGYINGVRVVSSAGPAVFPTLGTLWQIGKYQFGNQFNNGSCAEFRAYSRPLQAKEHRLLAIRPGIAYEVVRRRKTALVAGFRSHWARRQSLSQLAGAN